MVITQNFVLNGAAKKEPKIEKAVPQSQETTNTDEMKIDEQGVEDAEIISDEEDLDHVKMIKARFEMKKLEQLTKSNLSTPVGSVHGSKMKNPEDSDVSLPNSKVKVDINGASLEKLQETMLCVCCMDKPRCMLIQTCKHVPYC